MNRRHRFVAPESSHAGLKNGWYTLGLGQTFRGGFSLLELLAVVVILGVIAVIVIARINLSRAAAKEKACFQNKAEINAAVERFYFENGSMPSKLDDLDVPAYFPDGIPVCPVTNKKYKLKTDGAFRVKGHTAGSHE